MIGDLNAATRRIMREQRLPFYAAALLASAELEAEPTVDGRVVDDAGYEIPHADYPHAPGWLLDCAACALGPCVCDGAGICASDQCEGTS